jgi:nucleotide-binding universal stress UspA family protein
MKRILVPTDFSENALNAINYTRILFEKTPTTFYLLHVYKDVLSDVSNGEYGGERLDIRAEEVMNDLKSLLRDIQKTNTNTRHYFKIASKSTSLIPAIMEIVRTNQIDYIVMGSKGPKGAIETFLGGNAVTVIKKVDLPIIIVPKTYVIERPSQIVFSTNFNRAFNKSELATLLFLAKLLCCKIKVVQIMLDTTLNDFQKVNKEHLKDLFKGLDFHFHKIDMYSSETAAIRDFVTKTESDMISLVNHKQNFFYRLTEENVVKKVTFNSPVPILVLPQLV